MEEEQISTLLPEGYDPNVSRDPEGMLKKGIAKSAAYAVGGAIAGAAYPVAAAIKVTGPVGILGALAAKTVSDTGRRNKELSLIDDEFRELGGSNDDLITLKEMHAGQEERKFRTNKVLAEFLKGNFKDTE